MEIKQTITKELIGKRRFNLSVIVGGILLLLVMVVKLLLGLPVDASFIPDLATLQFEFLSFLMAGAYVFSMMVIIVLTKQSWPIVIRNKGRLSILHILFVDIAILFALNVINKLNVLHLFLNDGVLGGGLVERSYVLVSVCCIYIIYSVSWNHLALIFKVRRWKITCMLVLLLYAAISALILMVIQKFL